MKVMVVDEGKHAKSFLTKALTYLDHEVKITNYNQLIAEWEVFKPDLFILSLHSVDNGVEYAKKIRKRDPDISIVFLCDGINDDSIVRGLEAGGDDFLLRSYPPALLAAKLKQLQNLSNLKKNIFQLETKYRLTDRNKRMKFNKFFIKMIEDADARNLQFALLFIDFANFKMNENRGVRIKDALLNEVANRLKKLLRANDFIARFGGDEFIVILKDIASIHFVEMLAKKIIKTLSEPFSINQITCILKFYVGISCYPKDGVTLDTLMQSADIALHHAILIGKNNYQFHHDSMSKQYKEKIQFENELNFALDKKEFVLNYQPIFELKTKKMVGMEVLIRWNHPTQGLLLPDNFILIAEQSGMIVEISEWAFDEICRQVSEWRLKEIDNFRVSFNFSPVLFLKKNITEKIVKMIKNNELPAYLFEAELTETVMMSNKTVTENIIHEFKEAGITFSIDDFGTGYSSLTHLKVLPVKTIKIDKIFIKNVNENGKDAIIVDTIIQLGSRMHLDVVAEGIETEGALHFLLEHQCPKGQGNLLCPPLNVEKMTALLKKIF